MKSKTIFSYGANSSDLTKTNSVVLTNFINDINNLEVEHINICSEVNGQNYDAEKKLGEIFKNKTKLRNSFAFITNLYIEPAFTTKEIIAGVKRSINALRIEKIAILKVDLNKYDVDIDVVLEALVELKEQQLIEEIALANVSSNQLDIVLKYITKHNLKISYLVLNMPILNYNEYLENYSLLVRIYKITIIFDNVLSNEKLELYPNITKFISETGYSVSEFAVIYLNNLNCHKMINISTTNMKLYSELLKLTNVKLQPEIISAFNQKLKEIK